MDHAPASEATYYAIYTPQSVAESARVFTEISQAASESRKINARFKVFKNEMEARRFSETGAVESPVRERKVLLENMEKSPSRLRVVPRNNANDEVLLAKPFPSPPQRELSALRIAIEKGNAEELHRCMRENPRYFISSYDKPVILFMGTHFNALHCAARTGQKEMAETLMNYLLSDRPWNKLYPTEDIHSVAHTERRNMVIDGYFNTSDKGCGETPLHFACKFGHLGFVQWLLQFTQVDITRRNKNDQTAAEVAGTRCAETEDVRRKVNNLIQESRHSVYVPVIRAVDNSTPPFIGQPVTPEALHFNKSQVGDLGDSEEEELEFRSPISYSSPIRRTLGSSLQVPDRVGNSSLAELHSPLSPSLYVCAYAGPMLLTEAKEFRKQWKTPARELPVHRRDMLQGIMRGDSDRGLERVGRDLAVQQKFSWKEYWHFLDDFLNLREDEGLQAFEKFLADHSSFFINGHAPSKLDQDVFHALPPGGVTQWQDKYPHVCKWYRNVLIYPEDERKCWTTPASVRRTKKMRNKSPSNRNSNEGGDDGLNIVRNLMVDLSMDDNSGDDIFLESVTEQPGNINDILAEGISNLSVQDSNKLFNNGNNMTTNKIGSLFELDLSEELVNDNGLRKDLPPPITQSEASHKSWKVAPANEARLRVNKSANPTPQNSVAVPRGGGRRNFFNQVFRWVGICTLLWTCYFIYVYFNSDFFDEQR